VEKKIPKSGSYKERSRTLDNFYAFFSAGHDYFPSKVAAKIQAHDKEGLTLVFNPSG